MRPGTACICDSRTHVIPRKNQGPYREPFLSYIRIHIQGLQTVPTDTRTERSFICSCAHSCSQHLLNIHRSSVQKSSPREDQDTAQPVHARIPAHALIRVHARIPVHARVPVHAAYQFMPLHNSQSRPDRRKHSHSVKIHPSQFF